MTEQAPRITKGDRVVIHLSDGDSVRAVAERDTEPEDSVDGSGLRLITDMGTVRWRYGEVSVWWRVGPGEPMKADTVRRVERVEPR